jgi:polyprenyl-phospho-N-acetylgalactosaminyl synthase
MFWVVVPAYNEEKKIGRVVRDLFQHGYQNILVVDDGSVDETAREAEAAGAKVFKHAINRGQGASLATGTEAVLKLGANVIVHFDGDGQFNPADIGPAIEFLKKNNLDEVLGSRFLDQRSKVPWLKRQTVLPFARIVNRLLTGVKLTDAHNGFRILNRNAAEKIQITQDGMAHNSEIVAELARLKLSFREFPVEVKYFEYGQGISGGLKILKEWMMGKMTN